jgi:hypothetical protein
MLRNSDLLWWLSKLYYNMDKREQKLSEIEKEQNSKKDISHVIHLSDPSK